MTPAAAPCPLAAVPLRTRWSVGTTLYQLYARRTDEWRAYEECRRHILENVRGGAMRQGSLRLLGFSLRHVVRAG